MRLPRTSPAPRVALLLWRLHRVKHKAGGGVLFDATAWIVRLVYDVTLLRSKMKWSRLPALLSLSLSLSAPLEASLATVAILLPLRQMEDAEVSCLLGGLKHQAGEHVLPCWVDWSTRIVNAIAAKVPFHFPWVRSCVCWGILFPAGCTVPEGWGYCECVAGFIGNMTLFSFPGMTSPIFQATSVDQYNLDSEQVWAGRLVRGPRSLLVLTVAVRSAWEAIQVVMVTTERGHRCVFLFSLCSSHWVGCFRGGGRQWEKIPEVKWENCCTKWRKRGTDKRIINCFSLPSFSISPGGREQERFLLDWRGEDDGELSSVESVLSMFSLLLFEKECWWCASVRLPLNR